MQVEAEITNIGRFRVWVRCPWPLFQAREAGALSRVFSGILGPWWRVHGNSRRIGAGLKTRSHMPSPNFRHARRETFQLCPSSCLSGTFFSRTRVCLIDDGQVTRVSDCWSAGLQADRNFRECLIASDNSLVKGLFMGPNSPELKLRLDYLHTQRYQLAGWTSNLTSVWDW